MEVLIAHESLFLIHFMLAKARNYDATTPVVPVKWQFALALQVSSRPITFARLISCSTRQFEIWDVLLKKIILSGYTSTDRSGILLSDLTENHVAICEAELLRVYTLGRKGEIFNS